MLEIYHFGKLITKFVINYLLLYRRNKMNIFNKSSIIDFFTKHTNSKLPPEIWYEDVTSKHWKTPNELKSDYGANVSVLKNNRAVFDIKGNTYRLIAELNYKRGWLFIKFIGTHSEYDKIDAHTINFFKPKKKSNPKKN